MRNQIRPIGLKGTPMLHSRLVNAAVESRRNFNLDVDVVRYGAI